MALLGVLIVGVSALFVGGAFASGGNSTSTATHEHHNATDPAGPQHAGNQVGATGNGGAPDNTENASAESDTGGHDPAGSQPADNGTAAADNGTDSPDNSAESASGE